MTDLIILATLLPGPKHGYQLKHEAGLILGQQSIHNNLVYPLLRRFMGKAWVSKKVVPGERGQKRQQYTLTAAGRKELIDRLSSYSEQETKSADGFRLRVGLFDLLSKEARQRILAQREQYLLGQKKKFDDLQQNFALGIYAGEVVTHLNEQVDSELRWVQSLRRLAKKQAGQ